jgi:ABC-type spermidine/putrescine transport system permease subunit I
MEWSWKVFLIALPIAVIFSMFSRGAMNAQNVAKHGPEADYRANLSMAIFGSIIGGSVWAAIITVIIGLF